MELFNYIRNSGYERESPFVNDVKFHPVLKAKKSFASGILAAFTSSDASNVLEKQKESALGENGEATPVASSGIFGKIKTKLL